jgi:hypothetical protein
MIPLSGTVNANKDSASAYQPLLLATVAFADGSILNLSTHPINEPEGGFPWPGAANLPGGEYLARISTQDMGQLQSRSQEGVDRIPSIALHLADPDKFLWTNFEQQIGFKGATVSLNLVMWQADTANFSSDAPLQFQGVCDGPNYEGGLDTMTVTANSSHNTSRVYFPIVPLGPTCPWAFPPGGPTANPGALRLDGATNRSSVYWECGYDPDQAGTDPDTLADARCGNLTTPNATDAAGNIVADANGVFITCDYTKPGCVARGMYTQDSAARPTGRFGGVQWSADPGESQHNSYLDGHDVTVFNSQNTSIIGNGINQLYGTEWVNGQVVNIQADGNLTQFEVIVCLGDVGIPTYVGGTFVSGIEKVLVNGILINYTNNFGTMIDGVKKTGEGFDPLTVSINFDSDMSWSHVTTGLRTGAQDTALYYGGPGDPYGSICTIVCQVYQQLGGDGSQFPTVQVLASGTRVAVFSDPTQTGSTVPMVQSNNPAWVLMDILTWANWQYSDFDLPSFMAAAAFCDTWITYTDLTGNPAAVHARFICEVAIDQRRTAAELIQSILWGFRAQLINNYNGNGLLYLMIRESTADQQPLAIAGSNYNTAITSVTANGTIALGYLAYLFDENSIIRTQENGKPAISMKMLPNSSTPNRIIFPFQDSANAYVSDSLNIVDTDAVQRAGGYLGGGGNEVPQNVTVMGVSNFDQGIRMANTILAESLRGNEAQDTRGTRTFTVTSTVRVAHLRVGMICIFAYQQLQLTPIVGVTDGSGNPVTGILVRITSLQPTTNYTRTQITFAWHDDDWYEDTFGQNPAPFYAAAGIAGAGIPLPWRPDSEVPHSNLFSATDLNFSVSQIYQTLKDGSALAQLIISGRPPANTFSKLNPGPQRPLVPRQGLTAATGGSILGPTAGSQAYVIAICAVDSTGALTPMSHLIQCAIPAGTDTNTLDTGTLFWTAETSGYQVFAGTDINHLSWQATGTGTPDSITLTALLDASYGPPDPSFDHFRVRAKRVFHDGVFGLAINGVTATTVTFGDETFGVNQWAGYTLSIIGKPSSQANVKIIDLLIASNTATVLTLDSSAPDPTSLGVAIGDVAIMRALADTFSALSIGCSNFINSVNYYDPPIAIASVSISGTTATIVTVTANGYETGQDVILAGAGPLNGEYASITVIADDTFTVTITGPVGDYPGGGTVQASTNGLVVNGEVGNMLRIIAGTGGGQRPRLIASNTSTVCVPASPFNPVPDATSIFIIEEASWQYDVDTAKGLIVSNPNPATAPQIGILNVDNLQGETILVEVLTADAVDTLSLENYAPFREIFLFGAPGSLQKQFDKAIWNLGMTGDITVATDIAPHYRVKNAGSPLSTVFEAKIPPQGGSLILDIIWTNAAGTSTASIFASPNSGGSNQSTADAVGAGSTTLQSATANFNASVVGAAIQLSGGTAALVSSWYYVVGFTNATTITVDRIVPLGIGASMTVGGYAIAIPSGDASLLSDDIFTSVQFAQNDLLTVNCLETGPVQAGRMVTLELKWTIG